MSKIIGDCLPQVVIDLFDREITTAVLSTITEDGNPHAMPVHLLKALDENTIRFALVKNHQTTLNIKHNGKVILTVLDGHDIALGIKGDAKVVKEPMDGNKAMVLVEMIVSEIKSDTTPTVIVTSGVRAEHRTDKTAAFFRAMFDELEVK